MEFQQSNCSFMNASGLGQDIGLGDRLGPSGDFIHVNMSENPNASIQ
jgi:hypothetical protein